MAPYVPILTRTPVAPPDSVSAGTICVSPTGSASGDGTPGNPYDFVTGNAALTDGGTLLLLDGIYTLANPPTVISIGKAGQTLQTTVKAQTGARPILTATNGSVIFPVLEARTTVDGLWFGGARGNSGELQNKSDCIVQNCTFFNYLEAIGEGSDNTRNQYLNNRFVNCGDGSLLHDIYISNTNAVAGEGAVIRGGIHVGGEGYKIHLWHDPKYTTIQNNFCTHLGSVAFAIQGDGHTVDHNIGWNARIDFFSPTNTTVTKNIAGPTGAHNGGLGTGSTSDGNISVAPAATWGTNPTQWTQAQWAANTGYSVAQIDDTINQLIGAFQQSTADIWIDSGIEPLFTILAAVRDAVAGLVPWPDSPPQAPQAAIDLPFHHGRGGIPLSRRHKGGRNRRRVTRSRRLTTR